MLRTSKICIALSKHYVLVDFKRVLDKTISSDAFSFGKFAKHPALNSLPANDFYKYSLQQSIYAVLLEQAGLTVERPFVLLQLDPNVTEYRLIECADLTEQAQQILDEM